MSKLNSLFPSIQSRDAILDEIRLKPALQASFESWLPHRQQEFLDVCSGVRGHRILYDMYFKYVFDPKTCPDNLKGFLGVILGKKIRYLEVLSTNSALVDETHSLMVMDILVQLEDGTIVNVEIQKIGYKFPGQRAACYSADLLLRQYARLRRSDKTFSYEKVKPVITIVLMESSTPELRTCKEYQHTFTQKSDTGLRLPLLQEYCFIALDIFRRTVQDKAVEARTEFEAWLTFLTAEDPDEIYNLVQAYPEFKPLYQRLYELCRNVEGAMNMFSEQLRIMDRNTTKLMIDELKEQVSGLTEENKQQADRIGKLEEIKGQQADKIERLQAELNILRKQKSK